MSTFVLEIGSEEIPSRFLPVEKQFLQERFEAKLAEEHLEFGQVCVYVTPRRACVQIKELASVQETREELVAGPPKRIAYTAEGAPTKALEGFLRTQSLTLDDLFEQETEKGVYIAARRTVGGKSASAILAEITPAIIKAIPFAKQMRWGSTSLAYARPLHWIVALLDDAIVPFSLGPVESGRLTYGHRIHGIGPFSIPAANDYFVILEESCHVMIDGEKRRAYIREKGDAKAKALGGRILWKDSLLQEVEGLVEHPVPLLADFDPSYLEVPKEVLLTSMETHQKSFGVEDAKGVLLPHFLTVLNLDPDNEEIVKKGWERVLHARLEDARFFWREDLHANFDAWLKKLDDVIFIGPLGSMGDKTRRLATLCSWICKTLSLDTKEHLSVADAERAGRLSKADLVSSMVGEFDTLQGIMGGIYAEKLGESPCVAQALKEQYLPQGPDSPVPASILGAVLSLADKADTLAGCFGLNKIPTGAADPFALRRAALGIIRICKEFRFDLSIHDLLAKALELYGDRAWKKSSAETLAALEDFVSARLSNYLQSLGFSVIVTEACLRASFDHIPDAVSRVEQLARFSGEEEYVPSVQVLKRIANIVQKEKPTQSLRVDEGLFAEPCEGALANQLASLAPLASSTDYAAILASLYTLRPYVDTFFNEVMVLCDDEKIKANRLALLSSIHALYARVADFSALQI